MCALHCFFAFPPPKVCTPAVFRQDRRTDSHVQTQAVVIGCAGSCTGKRLSCDYGSASLHQLETPYNCSSVLPATPTLSFVHPYNQAWKRGGGNHLVDLALDWVWLPSTQNQVFGGCGAPVVQAKYCVLKPIHIWTKQVCIDLKC